MNESNENVSAPENTQTPTHDTTPAPAPQTHPCMACHETGKFFKKVCPTCNGKGIVGADKKPLP
jgi:DnaJ-class molecular chaperone